MWKWWFLWFKKICDFGEPGDSREFGDPGHSSSFGKNGKHGKTVDFAESVFFSGDNADHGHLDEFGEYGDSGDSG